MKKSILLVAAGLFAVSSAFAQFTSSNEMGIGDNITYYVIDTTGMKANPSLIPDYKTVTGNGVTWDYSSYGGTGTTNPTSVVAPSGTPYGADYSNASKAFAVQNYMTTYLSSDSYFRYGEGFVFNDPVIGDVIVKLTTDNADYYEYPFSLGDVITDNFAGKVTADLSAVSSILGVTTFDATGNLTATFDGIGTLKLAANNYSNVYRYRIEETASAPLPLVGNAYINRTQYEYYDFSVSKLPIFIYSFMEFDIPTFDPSGRTVIMSYDDPNTLKVNENSISSFRVYPNPVADLLNIDLANEGTSSIEMIDNLGKVVYSVNAATVSHAIDVSSFNSGVYFVKVINKEGTKTQKVIVE